MLAGIAKQSTSQMLGGGSRDGSVPDQDAGGICKGPFAPGSGDAARNLTTVEDGGRSRQRLVGRQVHVHREQVLPVHHLAQACMTDRE